MDGETRVKAHAKARVGMRSALVLYIQRDLELAT